MPKIEDYIDDMVFILTEKHGSTCDCRGCDAVRKLKVMTLSYRQWCEYLLYRMDDEEFASVGHDIPSAMLEMDAEVMGDAEIADAPVEPQADTDETGDFRDRMADNMMEARDPKNR